MVWSSFFRTCHGGDSLKWLLLDLHNVIKQRSLCQHWRLNQSCGGAQRSLASYLDGDSVLIMLKCFLSVDDSLQLVFVSRNWSYEAVMAISCQFCSGTTVSYMPLYNTFDWHEAVRFFGGGDTFFGCCVLLLLCHVVDWLVSDCCCEVNNCRSHQVQRTKAAWKKIYLKVSEDVYTRRSQKIVYNFLKMYPSNNLKY